MYGEPEATCCTLLTRPAHVPGHRSPRQASRLHHPPTVAPVLASSCFARPRARIFRDRSRPVQRSGNASRRDSWDAVLSCSVRYRDGWDQAHGWSA